MSSIAGGPVARGNVVALPDLGQTELHPAMSSGEAALAVLRPSIARFLAFEPAVRLGDDPEAVHDMRVAGRRMRTAIRLFRGALPGWADGVREEIRWAASLLGEVRDLDVQRARLKLSIEDLEPDDRGVVHALDEILVDRRREAQERLVAALDSTRFERLRDALHGLGRGPGLASGEALRPIAELAPAMVEKRYRRLRRDGKKLGPDSPSADLHALRIRCKRARYALEFVLPLYGKPADALVSRLVRLQDHLGELHDAEVSADRLHERARDGEGPMQQNVVFVLGRLAELSTQRARKLRRRFPSRFASIRGRRWKDLKKAMRVQAG